MYTKLIVAHHNFNAHQPILVIFSRDVADRFVIPPLLINVSALPEDVWTPDIVSLQA